MAAKFENLLHEGQCIPEDLLLNYIEGKCTPEQNHQVEKHLLGCEFCTDALEGLRLVHPAKSKVMVDELNRRIDAHIDNSKNIAPVIIPFRFNYKIAAVITLFILFSGGYWFLKNKVEKKSLAENNSSAQVMNADSGIKQFVPRSNGSEKAAEPIHSEPRFSLKEKSAEQKVITPEKIQIVENNSKVTENDAAKQINDNSLSANENKSDEETAPAKDIEKKSREESNDAQAGSAAPVMTESVAFSKMNKERVASQQEDRLESQNPAELFTKAKTNYDQKKYAEAEIDFEKLINDTSSKYFDDSKWFLAICYAKTHKNAKSRKLLREIAHSASIHKKEAEGLLQE